MIEGCIVAKLVLGYLKDEGLYRTCAAFQDECSFFCDDNKELDNVFLTADLKTILDDYSQLRESGRENGMTSGPAVLKSLWNDLDVVIGQLKYATIPSSTPKTYTVSQSTRTRRLNNGRSRRSSLPKSQEQRTTTTTSPSLLPPAKPTGNTAALKLPLPRLSTNGLSWNVSPSSNKNSPLGNQVISRHLVIQSSQSNVSKEQPITLPRALTPVGSPVTVTSQCIGGNVEPARTVINVTPTQSPITIRVSDELAKSDNVVQDLFDDVVAGDSSGGTEFDQQRTESTAPPVIVVDEDMDKDQTTVNSDEDSLAHTHHNLSHDELHLRSPKRKGIQPKRRTPQGGLGTSGASPNSPSKQVPASAEVEMDLICSSDGLTPQSFLGTLLSTPLLQEKLAENINKVVGGSRQQSVGDETPIDHTSHSLMTTEASSNDMPTALNQGGNDIPVKEILDLMQADPAFDVLFSVFGLDALDALPSTAHATADTSLCAEVSAESSRPMDSLCSLPPSSAAPLPGALDVSSFPEENQSHSVTNVNTISPPTSIHQSLASSSSSTSDLHLSATSIVTDALLLLAGSPQKIPCQTQSHSVHAVSYQSTEKHLPKTPPEETTQGHWSTNSRESRVNSSYNRPSLITSAFPYVRTLDFNLGRTPEPTKRGGKRNNKSNKSVGQKMTADKSDKASSNKKKARNVKRSVEASNSSSSSSSSTAICNSNVQSVTPTTVSRSMNICAAQSLNNCARQRNLISSSVVNVVPSAPPIVWCSSAMSSSTTPSAFPDTVCSSVVRSTPLPGNLMGISSLHSNLAETSSLHGNLAESSPLLSYPAGPPPCPTPAAVTHVTLGSRPGDSPVTTANLVADAFTAPVSVPTTAARQPKSHASHPSPESDSLVLMNPIGSTFHPVPPTVNFPTSTSSHVPSTVTLGNKGFGSSPSFQHLSSTLTVQDSPVNPVAWSTAPSPNLTSSVINQLPLPTSLARSNPAKKFGASLLSQAFNTLTPTSLIGTDRCVLREQFTGSSTNDRNSMTGPGRNVNDPSLTGSVASNAEVTTTTTSSEASHPLNAPSSLQTFVVKHKNSDEPQKTNQVAEESNLGAPNTTPRLASESTLEPQSLEKNLASKSNEKSQRNTGKANEKHNDEIPHNGSVKDLTSSVPISGIHTEALESKSGSTDSLTTNAVSGDLTKENSAGMVQSGSNCELEGRVSLTQSGKRRRDLLEREKEKNTRSLSRPSKRSKTKGGNVNFPSDLNVEDFLSKLHYEV